MLLRLAYLGVTNALAMLRLLPMSDDRARRYAEHIMAIARVELAGMPNDSVQNAIEYAVLGTSLYEPVILAMRRLAHQDLAAQMFADDDENT